MTNAITTIQLRESVKRVLESLKEKQNQSYEDVIVKLIDESEMKKKMQEELIIEGCKEMYNDMLEITKEWESTDAMLDWEWDDGSQKR